MTGVRTSPFERVNQIDVRFVRQRCHSGWFRVSSTRRRPGSVVAQRPGRWPGHDRPATPGGPDGTDGGGAARGQAESCPNCGSPLARGSDAEPDRVHRIGVAPSDGPGASPGPVPCGPAPSGTLIPGPDGIPAGPCDEAVPIGPAVEGAGAPDGVD